MVNLDALPGQRFTAFVQAVDPLIDTNGRSVGIRGCIDNRQLRLRPGMFARVTAVFGERERALVIPEEAIVPQGQRVLVYKVVDGSTTGEKIAQRVEVKLGIRRPGRVEVLEGLAEGDQVVTAGQQRLQRDGMAVRVIDTARANGRDGGREGGPPGANPATAASGPQSAAGPAAVSSAPAMASAQSATAAGVPGGANAPPLAVAMAASGRPAGGSSARPAAPSGPNPCFANASDAPGSQGRAQQTANPPGAQARAGRPAGVGQPMQP